MRIGKQKREILKTKEVSVTVFWVPIITSRSGPVPSQTKVLIGHKANLLIDLIGKVFKVLTP